MSYRLLRALEKKETALRERIERADIKQRDRREELYQVRDEIEKMKTQLETQPPR